MDADVGKAIQRMRNEHERKLQDLQFELREMKTKLHIQETEMMELQKKYDSCVKKNTSLKSELQTIKNAKTVNQVEEGKFLSTSGVGAEAVDEKGRTALHLAAWDGRVEDAWELLCAGADTRAQDAEGRTPLHHALLSGEEAAAELLSDADAAIDLQDSFGYTPLHFAAMQGHVGVVGKLLHAGANTRARDTSGVVPLHLALLHMKEPAAELLSGWDAGVDSLDASGSTPLHCAADRGYVGVIRKLLRAGADARARDGDGRTPLHLALLNGEEALVEPILEIDAANDLPDDNGCTPLHVASEYGVFEAVKKLLRAGANPLSRDCLGRTPLYWSSDVSEAEDREIVWEIVSTCVLRNIALSIPEESDDLLRYCVEVAVSCSSETRRMRRMRVGRFSYLDVASRRLSKVAALLRNEDIRSELLGGATLWRFPLYSELLACRVREAEERRVLTNNCLQRFALLPGQWPCLPQEVVEHILTYLTAREMRKFVQAFIRKA